LVTTPFRILEGIDGRVFGTRRGRVLISRFPIDFGLLRWDEVSTYLHGSMRRFIWDTIWQRGVTGLDEDRRFRRDLASSPYSSAAHPIHADRHHFSPAKASKERGSGVLARQFRRGAVTRLQVVTTRCRRVRVGEFYKHRGSITTSLPEAGTEGVGEKCCRTGDSGDGMRTGYSVRRLHKRRKTEAVPGGCFAVIYMPAATGRLAFLSETEMLAECGRQQPE